MVQQDYQAQAEGQDLLQVPCAAFTEDKRSSSQGSNHHSDTEEGVETGSEGQSLPPPCLQLSGTEDLAVSHSSFQDDLHEVSEEDDERDDFKAWQRKIRKAQKKTSRKIVKNGRGFYGKAAAGLIAWDGNNLH
jgi:hypothetical protein